MKKVKFAILGAGTSGLTALGLIRQQTDDFVMINGGSYGTTCARVGCMPSKAMIHPANLFHQRAHLADCGIHGGEALKLDSKQVLKRVCQFRDRFTSGVQSGSTDTLKPEQLITGYAKFTGANTLQVNDEVIQAERIIIATGSRPVIPEPWLALGDKLITSDEIFELECLPKRMAVIGLGIIGLELGQALARLGVEVIGIEKSPLIGGLTAPETSQAAVELFAKEFTLYRGVEAKLTATEKGVLLNLPEESIEVDMVLAALGRRPNIDQLALEKTGVTLNERGLPNFDTTTMQIENKALFIAGDVNADRPVLHEASHEGKIAGLNALQYPNLTGYKKLTPLGIAFTDPNIGFFGSSYQSLSFDNVAIANFNLHKNNGRAIVMGEDHGVITLYADKTSQCLLGGELVMPHAEHFAHLLAWCVAQNLTIKEILQMPFYHPVLEEAIQNAMQNLFKVLNPEGESTLSASLQAL